MSSIASPVSGADYGEERDIAHDKALFRAASRYINPSLFFRFIVYLYGERKLLVFFWLHFVATMTIWVHFGLIKFQEQRESVPDGAPFYWWKRIAPPLEFGSMHAILFQMALIPLTMSRYSIAALSGTVLDQFVPLNRAVRIHIHLGYVMIGIVFFATVFFFAFFGLLCANGDEAFCAKFTSEIMCTGYGILASLLIIGGTSYFRHHIPYEVFYIVHHLVFAMYILTIMHTVDKVQRDNGRNRSQTFKWFSSTLLYYLCDRMAMRLNHRYKTRVVSASAVRGGDGSRMLHLKIPRPVLFHFKPGQYAFLKQPGIDSQWHPFSIASGPSSRFLEFYIEVFGPCTWTGQLWELLSEERNGLLSERSLEIEIMGPYGTALAKKDCFSHTLLIGAGTGIVPVLSMFKEHARNVLHLSPSEYFKECDEWQQHQMEYELARDTQKGSIAKQVLSWFSSNQSEPKELTRSDLMRHSIRSSIRKLEAGDASEQRVDYRELKRAASKVTNSIYGVLFLAFLSVLGVTLLGLTISWNTIPIELYSGMTSILKWLMVVFQSCFAIPALFVWDGNNLFAMIDAAMCVVAVLANVVWFHEYNVKGTLSNPQTVLCSLLTGYMVGRLWVRVVCARRATLPKKHGNMKRLEVVWVARSASLISELLPDINQVWDSVVEKWGLENAMQVVRFSVYCTDQGESSVNQLRMELEEKKLSLYQSGCVRFGRPEFDHIIEDQTLEVIGESRTSHTLLAFCGSPNLAETIHRYQVSNFMLAAVTGHKKHQMEFVSESYGGVRKAKKQFRPYEKMTSDHYDDEMADSLNGGNGLNKNKDKTTSCETGPMRQLKAVRRAISNNVRRVSFRDDPSSCTEQFPDETDEATSEMDMEESSLSFGAPASQGQRAGLSLAKKPSLMDHHSGSESIGWSGHNPSTDLSVYKASASSADDVTGGSGNVHDSSTIFASSSDRGPIDWVESNDDDDSATELLGRSAKSKSPMFSLRDDRK